MILWAFNLNRIRTNSTIRCCVEPYAIVNIKNYNNKALKLKMTKNDDYNNAIKKKITFKTCLIIINNKEYEND